MKNLCCIKNIKITYFCENSLLKLEGVVYTLFSPIHNDTISSGIHMKNGVIVCNGYIRLFKHASCRRCYFQDVYFCSHLFVWFIYPEVINIGNIYISLL